MNKSNSKVIIIKNNKLVFNISVYEGFEIKKKETEKQKMKKYISE